MELDEYETAEDEIGSCSQYETAAAEVRSSSQRSTTGPRKKRGYTRRNSREDVAKIQAEIFGPRVPIPTNPHFVVKYRPSKRSELNIPLDLLKHHHLELPTEMKLIDDKGKGSVSKVRVWKCGRTTLSGWQPFCLLNDLKAGDNCLLEFKPDGKNKKKLCLQVRFFRA